MENVIHKYFCVDCSWSGDVLGDKETDEGVVECCMMCGGDNIDVNCNNHETQKNA